MPDHCLRRLTNNEKTLMGQCIVFTGDRIKVGYVVMIRRETLWAHNAMTRMRNVNVHWIGVRLNVNIMVQ